MTVLRLLAALFPVMLAANAFAQAPLRWKLAAGDELSLRIEQATTSDVAFSAKQVSTQIDLTMNLKWKVLAADAERFTIEQRLERLQFKMTPAKGSAVTYDSQDTGRLTGAAKDIAAALKPLMDSAVEVTMNARGVIADARPLKAADADPAAEGVNVANGESGISKSHIQQLLKQSLVILPETAAAEGDTWTSGTNIASVLGDFKQVTRFTLDGTVEQEGRQLANITSTTILEPAAAGGGPAPPAGAKSLATPALKSHEQSGKILFDADQGRVASAESSQKLVTERPFRETTIVVTLSSKQTTTIQPADKQ